MIKAEQVNEACDIMLKKEARYRYVIDADLVETMTKSIIRNSLAILLIIFPILIASACDDETVVPDSQTTQNNGNENDNSMRTKITIKIGDKILTATLSDNATAAAFKAMLPMTMTMTELNGNEKFFNLSNSLPMNASKPSSIQAGDLMMYGSSTLVLFYKTFATSYSYTKLGRVDDPAGLAAALGSGNVTISFEKQLQ